MSNKSLITISIISLFFSSHDICMDHNDYYCQIIEMHHNTKLETYKSQAIYENFNLSLEWNRITKKLLSFQNHLLDQKQKALDVIKNYHAINDAPWKSCMQLINDVEKFNKENKENLVGIHHDATIPEEALSLIISILKNNGINPQRIHIQGTYNQLYPYKITLPLPRIEISTLDILPPDTVHPGGIKINLKFFSQLSPQAQGGLCMLMAEHLIQNFSITPLIIMRMESQLSFSENNIINSIQFNNLRFLCNDTLPTLLLSIKDDTIAECLRMFHTEYRDNRNKEHWPRLLSTNDYNLLCKINRYWSILRWIKKCKTNKKL